MKVPLPGKWLDTHRLGDAGLVVGEIPCVCNPNRKKMKLGIDRAKDKKKIRIEWEDDRASRETTSLGPALLDIRIPILQNVSAEPTTDPPIEPAAP